MSEFRISSAQLQQYSQGLGPLASDSERGSHQTEAKSRLHEMARDLITPSGQVKSGYLRLQTQGADHVSVTTNRWQRSRQTDAATDLVRQLVKDAYGQNDQVEAALNAYLGSSAKNNKLGTRSFVKLVAELDRATTGQVQDQRLAGALQGRVGSLNTDLLGASFRLQQHGGQALALRERLGPLLESGARPEDRRQLAGELIALRAAVHADYPQLSDKTLKQSSARLMLDVEQNIDELLEAHCQDLALAMDHAATYQVGKDGNALEAMQSLQAMQEEMSSLQDLQDQTQYPIMSLTRLDALGHRAKELHGQFVDTQTTRRRDPKEALTNAGVPTRLSGAQDIQQSQARLDELHQGRRQGLLDSYAQAREAAQAGQAPEAGIAQAQARWEQQTAAIDAQAQGLINRAEHYHGQAHAQLDLACESLRHDMGDEASLQKLEDARAALTQSLADDRDRLQQSTQERRRDRLGAPQAALAGHLARGQWADAAPLLAAEQASPGDLAELAQALALPAQPDELARFMKAVVPTDARSRIDFLTQALPRGDRAPGQSAPFLICLNTLEQMEPGASLAMLGSLARTAGQQNPGSSALLGGANGQILRLDDKKNGQRVASAQQAIVSVSSPRVDLNGADLQGALVHIEYRQEHNNQAWAPTLKDARLDQARIVLDLSDLPRKINPRTGAISLDFRTNDQMVSLFGFAQSEKNFEADLRTTYFQDNPEAEELPDDVLDIMEAGPPARAGLHTILSSISTEYPQQRKDVACQLLDLAMQVPPSAMKSERLLKRSPLFEAIRQDPMLMADPDITLRLDGLSNNQVTRETARQALAERARLPA